MKRIVAALFALFVAASAQAQDSVYVDNGTFESAGLGNQVLCDCQDYMQWHLNFTHAREAWQVHTGIQSFKVGIASSGIDTTAFDLGGPYADGSPFPHPNMWRNPGEVYDGIDNDSNGYIDDVRGWNASGDFAIPGSVMWDFAGVGTAIATVMAAEGPASAYRGVGIAQNLTVVPAWWYTGIVGIADRCADALQYLRTVGCKIIVSHAGTNGPHAGLLAQVQANTAAGALTIWASGAGSGSGDMDACPNPCISPGNNYPQKYDDPGLLVVGGCVLSNGFGFQDAAPFSNWGSVSVDLFAPNNNANTLPNPPGAIQPPALRRVLTTALDEGWASWTESAGVSSAAMAAGAAALVWGAHPEFTAAQVKSILMATVDQYPGLAGRCVTGGMLNVQRACAYADSIAGGGQIEGVPQARESIRDARTTAPGKVYDVQGRRVDPSYQGVQYGARKRVVVKP